MEMVNPLAAFREGWDTSQGIFDTRTRRQAGNALAGGDYRGASNALLQGGMLDDGMQVQAFDQKRQQQDLEFRQAQEKQARVQQAEHLKTLAGGASALRRLPPEARRQAYEAQVLPLLQQMGLDQTPDGQAMLAHFAQAEFTDQQLDAFVATITGELQKPEFQIITPGNGQRPYAVEKGNPGSFQYVGPEVTGPQGEWKEVGGNLWFFPADGSRPQKGDPTTPKPKTYAPARPRSGGRRGGAAPAAGSAELPPGFVLE